MKWSRPVDLGSKLSAEIPRSDVWKIENYREEIWAIQARKWVRMDRKWSVNQIPRRIALQRNLHRFSLKTCSEIPISETSALAQASQSREPCQPVSFVGHKTGWGSHCVHKIPLLSYNRFCSWFASESARNRARSVQIRQIATKIEGSRLV